MDKKLEKVSKNGKTPKIDARQIGNIAPYAGLAFVVVLFSILTNGALLSINNLQAMASTVVLTAMCAIGSVFVFGAGYFDMSIGGTLCIAAVLGGKAMIATGSFLVGFVVILTTAVALALVKGFLAAYVELPFFIFTIILSSLFSAVVLVIMGNETVIYFKDAVKPLREFNFTEISIISVIALAAFFIFCLVMFNYTPLGVQAKNLGGNRVSATQSGIDTAKTIFTVFVISALGITLAAFILLLRTRTASTATAGGMGINVMVALVLGGMPLSGGPRSKISAGLLGSVSITVLNSGLSIMGLNTGEIQGTRGIVFLAVVLLSSLSYRRKLLPR